MKRKFTSEDLNQISYQSLEKRNKSELIDLTIRLRNFSIDLYERLNQNSTNSSKPPSSDSPFGKNNDEKIKVKVAQSADTDDTDTNERDIDASEYIGDNTQNTSDSDQTDKPDDEENENKRKPGRQPGSNPTFALFSRLIFSLKFIYNNIY